MAFSEGFSWEKKDPPWLWARPPDWISQESQSGVTDDVTVEWSFWGKKMNTCIHLSLIPKCRHDVSRCLRLCHHGRSHSSCWGLHTGMDCASKLRARWKPSSLKVAYARCIVTAKWKMTDTNNDWTVIQTVDDGWGFLRHVYGAKTVDRGHSGRSLRLLRWGTPEENGH